MISISVLVLVLVTLITVLVSAPFVADAAETTGFKQQHMATPIPTPTPTETMENHHHLVVFFESTSYWKKHNSNPQIMNTKQFYDNTFNMLSQHGGRNNILVKRTDCDDINHSTFCDEHLQLLRSSGIGGMWGRQFAQSFEFEFYSQDGPKEADILMAWLFFAIPQFQDLTQLKDIVQFLEKEKSRKNHENIIDSKEEEDMTSLEFVHITKTGGTALSKIAADVGVVWGECHYHRTGHCWVLTLYMKREQERNRPTPISKYVNPTNILLTIFKDQYQHLTINPWHAPLYYFTVPLFYHHQSENSQIENKNKKNGRKNTGLLPPKTFVIVRHPYTRALSEFYCPHHGINGKQKFGDPDDNNNSSKEDTKPTPTILNAWLQQKMHTNFNNLHSFLPQHRYVLNYDAANDADTVTNDNENENENENTPTRSIDYILHYETLEEDFQQLLSLFPCYNHIKYNPQERINDSSSSSSTTTTDTADNHRLTVYDLDTTTLQMINEYAGIDFELFGYEKNNLHKTNTWSQSGHGIIDTHLYINHEFTSLNNNNDGNDNENDNNNNNNNHKYEL